uniref:Protein elav n=1 Tax=Cacopsylla melanoneura TaxID=428564 RepID=A0A8D9E5L9_9HEMI
MKRGAARMDPKSYTPRPTTNLIVNYLPHSYTHDDLNELFRSIGEIKSNKVILTSDGESKGFGFVEFHHLEDARKAVRLLNGLYLENKKIKVSFAVPSEEHKKKCFTGDEPNGCEEVNASRGYEEPVLRELSADNTCDKNEVEMSGATQNGRTRPVTPVENDVHKSSVKDTHKAKEVQNPAEEMGKTEETAAFNCNTCNPQHTPYQRGFLAPSTIPSLMDNVYHPIMYEQVPYFPIIGNPYLFPNVAAPNYQPGRQESQCDRAGPIETPFVFPESFISQTGRQDVPCVHGGPLVRFTPVFNPLEASASSLMAAETSAPNTMLSFDFDPTEYAAPNVMLSFDSTESSTSGMMLSPGPVCEPPSPVSTNNTSIFVGNLHPSSEDVHLYRLFGPFGAVNSAHVVKNKFGRNLCKGYGFVSMVKHKDAALAVSVMNNCILNGKKLHVAFNKYDKEH